MGQPSWTWDDVWKAANKKRAQADPPRPRDSVGRRMPTDEERQAWVDSMPDAHAEEDLREFFAMKYPWLWHIAQSLLRKIEHDLKKRGMNPDDARWLL